MSYHLQQRLKCGEQGELGLGPFGRASFSSGSSGAARAGEAKILASLAHSSFKEKRKIAPCYNAKYSYKLELFCKKSSQTGF